MKSLSFILLALLAPLCGYPDGVLVIRDDSGQWGEASMGMTHQVDPRYQAKKILDLSTISDTAWAAVREVRLSAFFCVRDYSRVSLGKANGLDESFEVVVNGKIHAFRNNSGVPVYVERKPTMMAWFDFAFPKDEFVRGKNEIVFRKATTTKSKSDDYLYLGIDNAVSAGKSAVSLDGGKTWSSAKLNTIGAHGEYMVRLLLLSGERRIEATWRPGEAAGPFAYAGTRGDETLLEWHPYWLDPSAPVSAQVVTDTGAKSDKRNAAVPAVGVRPKTAGTAALQPNVPVGSAKFTLNWLDADGKRFTGSTLNKRTSGLVITSKAPVRSVTLRGVRGYHAPEPPLNITPTITQPAGKPANRRPSCRVEKNGVLLENSTLRCRFILKERRFATAAVNQPDAAVANRRSVLTLVSLFNELANAEMVRQSDKLDLFLVEVGTNHFSGTRDFECRSLRAEGRNGFAAVLFLPAHSLTATLTGSISAEGLRLALSLAPCSREPARGSADFTLAEPGREQARGYKGSSPLDFKVAFPHLTGLALSGDPSADYYFFPRGGGIIADCPALIRQGYGDHQALYQMMDLFSPSLGAGLSVRTDDADGKYKIFALSKHLPGRSLVQTLTPLCPTKPEFQFTNTFGQVTGTSVAVEYLRRTRKPGESFAPAPVVIAAHAGDWKTPMKEYAAWAHRVWKFRPPSRLDDVVTMIAAGWGQSFLFKDGAYRTDFLKPGRDCIELMSWWEWSPLGPWSTPFDKLEAKIGKASYTRWKGYFVKDPVTGQTMWNNQPGDYDGYNERFGGLPSFRKAVEDYKKSGALITLYTDPFRLDDASKTGQKHGKEWTVTKADGELARGYEVWNPCHDLPEVRQWVADTMERVMRETGADGIRLDEYGHRGWACYNPAHKHTFAETGCTEWQRATAEATKMVRAAMDKVNRRLVLTTEHPGNDYLMQFQDGCITYDLTVQATPLRPLECNTQRFYFPECKAYELDHRGADRDCHKRFWNMVALFGKEFPPEMYKVLKEHNDVLRGSDCEPLVPTLVPLVYANRFGSGKKTLWTLYNATGHTVDAPLIHVDVSRDQHVVDLLTGEELSTQGGVKLWLPRNGVACIARLPKQ